MIAPNEQIKEDFTVDDILRAFYVLLGRPRNGGKMIVLREVLKDVVPKNFMEKIKIESISDPDALLISILKKKKKRGVIKLPKPTFTSVKRLILPKYRPN